MSDAPDDGIEEIVDRLLGVTERVHHAIATVAGRYDLTPQQLALLRMLGEPLSMRAFAQDLSCDPSNVTGLVDRAERLGLVERVTDPDDRRVRMLTLTAKGRRIRDKVNRDLGRAIVDELGLGTDDPSQLVSLLRSVGPRQDDWSCAGSGLEVAAPGSAVGSTDGPRGANGPGIGVS